MDQAPPQRFRVRIKTLLVVVVFVGLLTAVIRQQVQIERMRQRLADITAQDEFNRIVQKLPPPQLVITSSSEVFKLDVHLPDLPWEEGTPTPSTSQRGR
jgi:hypothetical protein